MVVQQSEVSSSSETGILTLKQAMSGVSSKPETPNICEKCGKRDKAVVAREQKKWCSICIEGYQRQKPHERDPDCWRGLLRKFIPARYADAVLSDLPESLVGKFQALPDDRGLFLWGPTGTGKSHAMCAFAQELWFTGWDVNRISYDMLMLEIRDTYKPAANGTELDVILPYINVHKLIIEDVGTTVSVGAQETDFSLRTFLILLDQRLEACRATYITSNKSIEEIRKSFDARIASRLTQACDVIQLKGADRRTQK